MGTDIHGVFERRDTETGKWVVVESKYDQRRHYQLFAVLAGVRNGFGFANIKTGDGLTPIDEPRGMPKDWPVIENYFHNVWMGDHSHSRLTGQEMLAWYETAPELTKIGILDRDIYESWDGISTPKEYSTFIIGHDMVLIDRGTNDEENAEWTHIQCQWKSKLREELAYFFDEVARLMSEHGEVRFIFGFDS